MSAGGALIPRVNNRAAVPIPRIYLFIVAKVMYFHCDHLNIQHNIHIAFY